MAIATIDMKVNPFGDRGRGTAPEAEHAILTVQDEAAHNVYQQYRELLGRLLIKFSDGFYGMEYMEFRDELLAHFAYADLSPGQISGVFDMMLRDKELLRKDSDVLYGKILSGLINRSYERGNNNFFLLTRDMILDFHDLSIRIAGPDEYKLTIDVYGLSIRIPSPDKCKLTIVGDGGKGLGYNAKNLDVHVLGDVHVAWGESAVLSTFTIEGNAVYGLNSAEQCLIEVNGDWELPKSFNYHFYYHFSNCCLRSKNPDTYAKMKKLAEGMGHGNTAELIQ